MGKEIVPVEVESAGYHVMLGLAKVAAAVKQSLADGFQPGQDLPAIVVAAVAELPALVQHAQGVPAAFAEDKVGLIKGVNLGAYSVVSALVS